MSACGTMPFCAIRKIAVPGTRTGGASISPGRKVSSWMPSLRISWYSSSRPRRQVRSSVNRTTPSTTGNQPPSRILTPFAIRKPMSPTRNSRHNGNTQFRAFGHSARATSASNSVSISIVADTEMPYAVASAVEVRKVSTSPITSTISIQFTPGM